MAKVYSAPEPAPDVTVSPWSEYERQENEYVLRMQTWAREQHPSDGLAGNILRFPRGDGYAQYVVITSKPLALMHLAIGDAWDLPDWQLRGLRLTDVKAQLDWERRWRRAG